MRAVVENNPKFYFGTSTSSKSFEFTSLTTSKGSDSAPHHSSSKKPPGCAAGCFTQGWTTSLVIGALEEGLRLGWIEERDISQEAIEGFLSKHGRAFYKLPDSKQSWARKIRLERRGETIPKVISSHDGKIEVIPFRAGTEILSLSWRT